uniref:Uncharacterized protein n=1 Tax=Timema tahoe TaxID=61484 RepID=A0A7R9FER8_9NEOP|nr:unnamed protein product [Timema tahoe]
MEEPKGPTEPSRRFAASLDMTATHSPKNEIRIEMWSHEELQQEISANCIDRSAVANTRAVSFVFGLVCRLGSHGEDTYLARAGLPTTLPCCALHSLSRVFIQGNSSAIGKYTLCTYSRDLNPDLLVTVPVQSNARVRR